MTTIPEPTITPTPTAVPTVMPTATPTPTPAPTATPEPSIKTTPAPLPSSGPIYTVTTTFTGLILNSTSTVITGISGSLTNTNSGDSISGSINGDAYEFSHVSAGYYDLVVDIQYTVYYANNSTNDCSTRITDSFGVNGNVDKRYPLY